MPNRFSRWFRGRRRSSARRLAILAIVGLVVLLLLRGLVALWRWLVGPVQHGV